MSHLVTVACMDPDVHCRLGGREDGGEREDMQIRTDTSMHNYTCIYVDLLVRTMVCLLGRDAMYPTVL